MVGRYRALLIGNSTYPADEHNLQTLKGPVKDIAALNRALVDPDTGLFADVDVTLLPEATSSRAVRALGKFFAAADRDDVLLMYYSGHGKLDQLGRLHLCMQDTETTDLLSTAVSSVRISEFADASRAHSVVIILDCCYAGAFRGGEFGDAVAGPGRYVMSSCRGSQLANDATIDNGTSFFTQHLVEGLQHAADQDGDGYVSFSDLYAYVDRKLRTEGKQIPQRRVEADGDLPLARRSAAEAVSENVAAPPPAPPTARADAPGGGTTAGTRRGWSRRRIAVVAAIAAVAAAAVAALLVVRSSGGNGSSGGTPATGSYTAAGPWRIRIDGTAYGHGCALTLTEATSGDTVPVPGDLYNVAQFQVPRGGSFRWQVNDRSCYVTPLAGAGRATLPFVQEQNGDTDVFTAPAGGVTIHLKNNYGSQCSFRLFDAANGQELDVAQWSAGQGDVTMNPNGIASVYLYDDNCAVQLSAHG
jgi:Caspase domain